MVRNINTDATGRNMGHGDDQNHDHGFQVCYIAKSSTADPEKKGRYAVTNHEQANLTDKDLTWIPSMTNNAPQLKGVGHFGDFYAPGSTVLVGWHGPHKFIVGAIPNYEPPDDNKADYHSGAFDKFPAIDKTMPEGFTQGAPRKALGGPFQVASIYIEMTNQLKTLAQRLRNLPLFRPGRGQDACLTAHTKAMSAMKLGAMTGELAVPGLNHVAWSMGAVKGLGGSNAPMEAIAALGGGTFDGANLVKGACQMGLCMQAFAKQGALVDAMSIIGGMGNWMGALSSIMSLFSMLAGLFNPKQKQNKTQKQNQSTTEAMMAAMYESMTGLPAYDAQGNQTPEFAAWLQSHLTSDPITVTPDMIPPIDNPLAPPSTTTPSPEDVPVG